MNQIRLALLVILLASPVLASGRDDRAAAFANGPISFKSSGSAKWGVVSKSRSTEYTLSPVLESGVLKRLDVMVASKSKGYIQVADDGRFVTNDTDLVNIANVGSVLPGARKQLLAGGEVVIETQAEIGGKLMPVRVTHTRGGKPVGDWLVKVRSRTKSLDGRLDLVSDTILAPDGLPLQSETRGDFHQGAYTLRITSKLERK